MSNLDTNVDPSLGQPPDPMSAGDTYWNNAYSDYKLMAWKRAQGASDSVARAEAARTINSARTAQGNLPGEYADALSSGLRKISDQFENSGMWSSSNRLRAQNEEQGQLEGQMLAQRNAYADTIGGANISLAKQLAQGQMEGVEQQAAGADRVALQQAGAGIDPFAKPKMPNRLGGYR